MSLGKGYAGLGPGEFPMGALTSSSEHRKESDIEGDTFEGPRGSYKIVSFPTDTSIEVHYVGGEWKGKTINMDLGTHRSIQSRKAARLRVEDEQAEILLDFWYQKYPSLYDEWYEEGISSTDLLKSLEEAYPIPASNIRREAKEFLP